MADFIGPIEVPEPPTISAFPLRTDYGGGFDIEPPIVIHSFDQPGLKTEQRFVMGSGARRFRVRKDHLSCQEYDLLKGHWMQAQGIYAQFLYTHHGRITETVTARYENPVISFPHLVGLITGDPGVTLFEVPTETPAYSPIATVNRFPDSAFEAALAEQVQTIIPLIRIQPRAPGAAMIHLSNQRCTMNAQLFQARLLDWGGISQTLGEASDSAQFVFGNADGVFSKLVNEVNLNKATIEFSLFHVQSRYLVNLWTGYARPWSFDPQGRFSLTASDGVFELALSYPYRGISRTCWKVYKGRFCPSTSGLPTCPKSWEACVERGVPKSFGGMVVNPQLVRVKDNSTGVWGWGRSMMTSVTVREDTVYERPLQEIYTDTPMKVNCDVAGGRDESDFYSAIGIVSEGPIGGYASDLVKHTLDGSPPHDPQKGGGWRGILGTDPAATTDFFGLSQAPWNQVPPNSSYAAGLAFAEIRRSDEKGLQLSKISDRSMQVTVTGGMGGWTWTAPGARVWTPVLSNFVWVAVNVYLRALGLKVILANQDLVPVNVMEQYFDVQQAIAMAAIADAVVPKLVGPGTERQFPFRGTIKERKPLKDWLQEICNTGLGFFTFVNAKLWIGIRINSSVLAGNAFTRATILFKSLAATPPQVRFNWLSGQFGDEEFGWDLNNVTVYDIDHAAFLGTPESPEYISSTLNLVGVSNKSQAARIVSTRLREELGGVGPAEQLAARRLSFRTTVLALKTMVGDIVSLDHADLPNGRSEGRVQRWTLNPDFSIDIETMPTTDAMYDLTVGPKPEDVPAEPVPPELLPSPAGLGWMPNEVGPFADDPLYPITTERTFGLWQDYTITGEGAWDPAVWVRGEMPVNQFVAPVQPRILAAVMKDGGSISGPNTVYAAVTQRNANQEPTMPSNLTAIYVPEGATGKLIELTLDNAPSGTWAGYDVWAGLDRRRIGFQYGGDGAIPPMLPIHTVFEMTRSMPQSAARRVQIMVKQIWHAGVAGVLVSSVTAQNQIRVLDFVGSPDNWSDRILSAVADQSDGSAPLWNFRVTAFDSATGTFTVFPDCVRGTPEDSVESGDVLVVRSIASSATASTVTDPLWQNSVHQLQFGHYGLVEDAEKGGICRILRGKGAGQFRYITGNTATEIQVWPPWEVIPNATSIILIEAPDYVYASTSSDMEVSQPGFKVDIRTRVDNLRDRMVLVAGFLIDDQGRQTSEQFGCYREIYVFGQPPSVRVLGPDPGPWQAYPTDHTLRLDTSVNDITVHLPLLATYQGRTMIIVNDIGPFNGIVECAPDEAYFDGLTTLTIGAGQTLRVTSG